MTTEDLLSIRTDFETSLLHFPCRPPFPHHPHQPADLNQPPDYNQ